jgi:hypothetical protein
MPSPASAALIPSIAAMLLLSGAAAPAQTPQEHVHHMSHEVMPFDMAKTLHVFKMTEEGGIERVIARDAGDAGQIGLIQHHLMHEADRFQQGDYSDPKKLHGADMPGLRELEAGASQVKVTYSSRADGAEIVFSTSDPHLLTAIHRWFGAQLSEHGADAKAE